MAHVTGSWKDLGLGPVDPDQHPRLAFRLSAPAVAPGGVLLLRDPVYVDEFGSDGQFEVDVTRTDNLRPTSQDIDRVWIDVWGEWLEDSYDPKSGYARVACQLRVTGDGTITDFLDIPVITGQVVITDDEILPPLGPGVLIVDTSGDVPHLSYTK